MRYYGNLGVLEKKVLFINQLNKSYQYPKEDKEILAKMRHPNYDGGSFSLSSQVSSLVEVSSGSKLTRAWVQGPWWDLSTKSQTSHFDIPDKCFLR